MLYEIYKKFIENKKYPHSENGRKFLNAFRPKWEKSSAHGQEARKLRIF